MDNLCERYQFGAGGSTGGKIRRVVLPCLAPDLVPNRIRPAAPVLWQAAVRSQLSAITQISLNDSTTLGYKSPSLTEVFVSEALVVVTHIWS